jgi:NTE family protein
MGLFQRFKNSQPTIGLALSGGATHGAAHIGVLQVLEREGIQPDFVAGTSAGALIGAAYCAGVPLDDIERLFLSVEWPNLLKISLKPKLSIFNTQPMEAFLIAKIGDFSFTDLKIPLTVIACDITTGERIILNEGSVAQAIRASSAIPALFSPVEINGRLLVDGGIVDDLPVEQVVSMGAKFVIASDVSNRGKVGAKPENPIEVLLSAIYIMQSRSAFYNIDKSDCYIRPEISTFSSWGFKDSIKVLEAGRAAAEDALPELKRKLKNRSRFSAKTFLKR